MLQPALTTPAANQSAHNQPADNQAALDPAPPRRLPIPATYGSLMESARDALAHALAMSSSRISVDAGTEEIRGYQRFLSTAGNHLLLLASLADVQTDATRNLGRHLPNISTARAHAGAWYDAASLVGTAHDLLATHLADGIPRTVEAHQSVLGSAAASACKDLAEMVIDAVAGSRELVHQLQTAQRREGHRPTPKTAFYRIHLANQAISISARATLWDLAGLQPSRGDDYLARLPVALPTDLTHTAPRISTPLAALRLIRQLCHDQARGLTAASPASLRDLARLGARINTAALLGTERIDARDDRPLARLQRAHASDQIDAAHTAWTEAATDLTTTIHGLTKAGGTYAVAIDTLLTQPLDARTRAVLAAALPSLGRDAARTTRQMADRSDLVTLQQIPLTTRKAWRPITNEEASRLVSRFDTAAQASARALAAVREINRADPAPDRTAAPAQLRERTLAAERTRRASR